MIALNPLSQMDPRWKDKQLGAGSATTVGKFGCLLTCMAMVGNAYGHEETPESLNDKMKRVNGFQGALVIPALLPSVLPTVRFNKYIQCRDQPAPMVDIDESLASGRPVIVEVDYSPAVGMQNHWIVLYGKKGSDYLIQDPWPFPAETKDVLLKERYGFAGKPSEIITAALWFEGSGQRVQVEAPPKPKPIQKTGMAIFAAADGLALRRQPFVAEENLIKRLALNTRLYVMEAAERATGKIGKANEWLQVQESVEGYEGYVAAWYVSLEAQEPSKPPVKDAREKKPDQAASSLVVFSIEDALAMRKQPVIVEQTLIKRLPLNTELVVVEPAVQAIAKIGVDQQWLKVRDIEGEEGYVAAWYVGKERKDAALGVHPEGSRQPGERETSGSKSKDQLVVLTIEEGLALRTQPAIAETTLIKRLPLSSELAVLETTSQASGKIGVVNQWLQVRDIHGDTGYVAAWYVIRRI